MTMTRDKFKQAFYVLDLDGEGNRLAHPTKYWNVGGHAIGVVAVASFDRDGRLIDWGAYIGASDKTWKEDDCYLETAAHGAKLGGAEANYLCASVAKALGEKKYRK